MEPARIADLLAPFLEPDVTPNPCHSELGRRPGEEPAFEFRGGGLRLPPEALNRISTYIDILVRWNARINLTAIRDEEQIVTRHFGESLFAARMLFPSTVDVGANPDEEDHRGRAALQRRVHAQEKEGAFAPEAAAQRLTPEARVADLGSGAGFPGIPIKLWAPEISLTLIESNHKKATFLREVTRALRFTDVDIRNVRAETLPHAQTKDQFDVVTLRAVERFESILPVAACLVRPGGRLALLVGSPQVSQAHAILPAVHWSEPVPVPESSSRVLVVGQHQER